MLTKVALDSVFPHANENCETRTTLQNQRKEKGSQEKVHERNRNVFEGGEDLCTYRVAGNCDRATRRLPCWRKYATEPMASTDHFFFQDHIPSHPFSKTKKETKETKCVPSPTMRPPTPSTHLPRPPLSQLNRGHHTRGRA